MTVGSGASIENRDIVIRAITADDAADVRRILAAWLPTDAAAENLRRALASDADEPVVVAVEGGAVVGLMGIELAGIRPPLFDPGDSPAGLILAYVHPAWRGRGIGTALADHLERHAVALGCDRLVVVSGGRSRDVGYGFWRARYGRMALYERDAFGPGAERVAWSVSLPRPQARRRVQPRPAVLLRPPVAGDVDALADMYDDPVWAYFARPGDGPSRREIAAAVERGDPPGTVRRVVDLGSELVGEVQVDCQDDDGLANVAWFITRRRWGHGLGTAAGAAAVDLAFRTWPHVMKVHAHIDPRNVASVGVAERIGMDLEGHLKQHVVRRGERVDRLLFGLQRSAWDARPPALS